MISNEVGRDERVHLNENDVISNEMPAVDTIPNRRPWPNTTKSDSLLQEVQTEDDKPGKTLCSKIQGAIFPMIVLGIILGLVVMLFIINNSSSSAGPDIPYTCDTSCSMALVESIPENLTYSPGSVVHPSTFSAWKQLISTANKSLQICAMYWTLNNTETSTSLPSASEGEKVFSMLKDAIKRGVNVQIVQNGTSVETQALQKLGATVKSLNFTALLGAGILHTKFIIADNKSYYLGSANMDWRSLTQVKEMGVHVSNCQCALVDDLYKIFDIYWLLGGDNATIPEPWPKYMDTHYNLTHPLTIDLGGNETARVSLSSSPAPMCTTSRTVDIDAILSVMNDAKKYVYIAVMDYFPTTLYIKKNIYWPTIDDMLRKIAFEKKVEVRLLASSWNHTKPVMYNYLRSLQQFHQGIQVKVFVVPTHGDQSKIPYARVNHNKYMVTDRVAYIGTSNWSGDYFIDTAGVGMIFNQSDAKTGVDTIRQQLKEVFLRDWDSVYSHNVNDKQFDVTE